MSDSQGRKDLGLGLIVCRHVQLPLSDTKERHSFSLELSVVKEFSLPRTHHPSCFCKRWNGWVWGYSFHCIQRSGDLLHVHTLTYSLCDSWFNMNCMHTHSPQPETIQIADYYDLYNSLIVWSTRKWGCSGEHVTGLYTENEDGKLQALKADHDVLNLRENEVVVVEIKDWEPTFSVLDIDWMFANNLFKFCKVYVKCSCVCVLCISSSGPWIWLHQNS